jgi:hypothetical protein
MLCLAIIGFARPAEAGNGPPGGGYGGAAGGGYTPGSRAPAYGPNRSDDYDFNGPTFRFSVRKTPRPDGTQPSSEDQRLQPQQLQPQQLQSQQPQPRPAQNRQPNTPDPDFWQRFRNGFGVFSGD